MSPVLMALFVPPLIIGSCGCGAIGTKSDPTSPTGVHGRAVTPDGEPVPGVFAFLVVDEQARQQARTDERGIFEFAEAPAGALRLVLNDLHGRGAVRRATLYPDGENDLGDVPLGLLQSGDGIFDIRGVAFEERLTRNGETAAVGLSSDRRTAYGVSLGPFDFQSATEIDSLWRVDLETGAETFLRADFTLGCCPWSPLLVLGDLVFFDGGLFEIEGSGPAFVDAHTGDGVYDTPRPHHFIWGSLARAADATYHLEMNGLDLSLRLVRIGGRGEVTMGPTVAPFADTSFLAGKDVFLDRVATADPQRIVTWAPKGCRVTVHDDGWSCVADSSLELPGLYLFPLDGSAPRHVDTGDNPHPRALALVPDTPYLFADTDARGRISRIDLRDGSRQTVFELEGAVAGIQVFDGARSLLVTTNTYEGAIAVIDAASLKVTWVSSDVRVRGTRLRLCADGIGEWEAACTVSVETDATIRVAQNFSGSSFGTNADGEFRVFADFAPNGEVLTARVFQVDRFDAHLYREGNVEVARLHDAATGVYQLYVASPGADPRELRQITFVTADHDFIGFSPDARTVYYRVVDPGTGVIQIFRAATIP